MQRLLPPVLFIVLAAAVAALSIVTPLGRVTESSLRWLGLAAVAAGLVLSSSGSRRFAEVGTNIGTFGEPDLLVADGLFAWTRNPMYLGFTLALVGIAIAADTAKAPVSIDIGEVISATGLPASTLHVWESSGLIEPEGRRAGRRQFPDDILDRIAIIALLQQSDFRLDETNFSSRKPSPTANRRWRPSSTPYRSADDDSTSRSRAFSTRCTAPNHRRSIATVSKHTSPRSSRSTLELVRRPRPDQTTTGSNSDRVRREFELTVVELGKHVASKQIALSGMGVARQNEGTHTRSLELFDLAEHLVRVTNDGSTGT